MKKYYLIVLLVGILGVFFAGRVFAFKIEWLNATPKNPPAALKAHVKAKPIQGERALVRLLEKSDYAYASVRNYEVIFVKTEKQGKNLGPQEEIFFRFEKPFKIFMRWLNTNKKGLQVHYERGKNGGKLAIHQPGLLLGLMPVIFLDPNSPWVKEGSASHNIEEVGLGVFLDSLRKSASLAQKEKMLKVFYYPDVTDEGFEGDKVDIRFLCGKARKGYFASRAVVLFEAKTALPLKIELYDWDDEVSGIYLYKDLKTNFEKNEGFYKQWIHPNLLKIYESKITQSKSK